jgi:hypothetical protein
MASEPVQFGEITRRFLAGDLPRAKAAELIFDEFKKARGSNRHVDLTIDFGHPELSAQDRTKLQELFGEVERLTVTRLSKPRGTAYATSWHDAITIPPSFLKGFAVFLFGASITVFGIVDPDWLYLVFGTGLSGATWWLAHSRGS